MKPSDNMMTFLFSFEGRASRSEFWMKFGLPMLVIDILAGILDSLVDAPFLSWVIYLLAIWPGLAIGAKRSHDRNRSGWFVLLSFIPLLNFLYLVEVCFLKGTNGSNEYGPDPLS